MGKPAHSNIHLVWVFWFTTGNLVDPPRRSDPRRRRAARRMPPAPAWNGWPCRPGGPVALRLIGTAGRTHPGHAGALAVRQIRSGVLARRRPDRTQPGPGRLIRIGPCLAPMRGGRCCRSPTGSRRRSSLIRPAGSPSGSVGRSSRRAPMGLRATCWRASLCSRRASSLVSSTRAWSRSSRSRMWPGTRSCSSSCAGRCSAATAPEACN